MEANGITRVLAGAMMLVAPAAVAERVLLISIDGLRTDYLLEADRYDLEVRTLRSLMRAGTTADGVVPPTPSNTMPAHVTMITGVWPDRHGITDNDQFAPGTEDNARIYHYYSDIEVPTLFDAAAEASLTTAAIGWPVTTGAPVDTLYPESPGGVPEIAKFLYAETTPDLRSLFGSPAAAGDDGDAMRFRLATAALAERPDLMALHVGELDEAQHDHGPGSAEALQALEELDARLGEFLEAGCEAGHLEDTTFVVTADHGFRSLHTGVFLMPLFRALGLLETDADDEITSWTAYPWPAAGASPIYLHDDATPGTGATVDRLLSFLESELPHALRRVYRRDEMDEINGFPGAHALIALEDGYAFGGGFDNPLTRSPTRTQGIHGYVPDASDMYAALVAVGGGIRAGVRVGVVPMTAVAPTVAARLGIPLESADERAIDDLARVASPGAACSALRARHARVAASH